MMNVHSEGRMRIPRKYRPAIVAAAEGLVLVLSLAWCRSFGEAPFYAAVPAFLVYLVLVRPKAFRKLSWKHAVYFGFLAVLVGGYLAVFACMATTASWTACEAFFGCSSTVIWAVLAESRVKRVAIGVSWLRCSCGGIRRRVFSWPDG